MRCRLIKNNNFNVYIAGFRTVTWWRTAVYYIKYLEGESAGDNSTGTQNYAIGLGKKKYLHYVLTPDHHVF